MTSADSGTVPCLGSSTRLAAGRSTERSATRRESHTRSCASAWPRDRPGFSRPTMSRPTASSRPCWLRRNWPRRESGAQKSGATTVSPRKPSGITPTTWNGAPFTRTVRLSTPGSLAKCRDQARWLRTMARRPPGSSSDGVSVRPSAALAPSTWKKFPVTRRALHPRALNPAVDVGRRRKCTGEHARLADERFILRPREALGLAVRRSLTFDREQLVRVTHLVARER